MAAFCLRGLRHLVVTIRNILTNIKFRPVNCNGVALGGRYIRILLIAGAYRMYAFGSDDKFFHYEIQDFVDGCVGSRWIAGVSQP